MAGEHRYGAHRVRREDPALITGTAQYTDDLAPAAHHVAFLRNQYGHARIDGIDATAAEAMGSVQQVYTFADIASSEAPGRITVEPELEGQRAPDYPVMADGVARFTGETIAAVVAEDRYAARDGVEALEVEYERRDPVVDPRAALEDGAPQVHESLPDNRGLDWSFGDDAARVDAAFDAADHVVSVDTHNQRVHPDAMEPRAVLADWEGDAGGLTVRMATQAPFIERGLLASTLALDAEEVRVVAPAVGGGFGVKGLPYVEQIIVAWCAMQLGRPVKWVSTRSEAHLADHHGRDFYTQGELAVDDDGTIQAFRTEAVTSLGAYIKYPTSPWPNYEHLSSGAYAIPLISGRLRGAFTNTAPMGPYRGAGRPEIAFLLERLVHEAAVAVGMDPAELRRRNYIPPEAFPYSTPGTATYDSGDYERALDRALETVEYDDWRSRQASLRDEGRYLGIGIASFVENSGTGPGTPETGRVAVKADGSVTVSAGTADHGQGHSTAFAAVVAETLGVDDDDVSVAEGDTALLDSGAGTFGSRSLSVGGSALVESAREVIEHGRRLAATEFEADPADVEFEDGTFYPAGAPDRGIGLQALARRAGDDPGFSAVTSYDPANYGYSFGTHVAVVEVDPATGAVSFRDYVGVDDCGVVVNPMIVEGQIHGGVAQGIGQSLYEAAEYDENGTLLTGSLQDYALPKAFHIPEMEIHETETPAPHNPIGAKGVGESGTIAAPPAVVNAVLDALAPLGVDNLDMPLTGERVWRACRGAE